MMSVRRGIESLVCFILGTVGVPIASCAGRVGTRVSGATILAVTNVSGDGRLLAPTSAIDCGSGVVCLADPRSGLWRLDLVTGAMTLIGRGGEGPGENPMPRPAPSLVGDPGPSLGPRAAPGDTFPLRTWETTGSGTCIPNSGFVVGERCMDRNRAAIAHGTFPYRGAITRISDKGRLGVECPLAACDFLPARN